MIKSATLPAPVYCIRELRAIEAQAQQNAEPSLMERAGRAAAEMAMQLIGEHSGPALIACGPGNNAGDGFVMARCLLAAGRAVVVLYADDPERLPADARRAREDLVDCEGASIHAHLPATPPENWSLVVDALFGIGLGKAPAGHHAAWIEALNALPCPRLAIDLPSGLNADTGAVFTPAFRATHTLTFLALKPGLLTADGPDYAGKISVHTLDADCAAHCPPRGQLIAPALFAEHLRPRLANTHKGSYGTAAIIGGSAGMTGAVWLGARAALLLGCGRVLASCLNPDAPALDPLYPELMMRPPLQAIDAASAIAIGPGLGTDAPALACLQQALPFNGPLLLDADALNLLAANEALIHQCQQRQAATILTPHPAEAARLLDSTTAAIQSDRIAAALALAQRCRALVALKGCGTILATPDGQWFVNNSGHAGMASAGMGDVLSGLCAALLAQGWPPLPALMAAVHLHGLAAEKLAADGIGPNGLLASEIAPAARVLFNHWQQHRAALFASSNPSHHD